MGHASLSTVRSRAVSGTVAGIATSPASSHEPNGIKRWAKKYLLEGIFFHCFFIFLFILRSAPRHRRQQCSRKTPAKSFLRRFDLHQVPKIRRNAFADDFFSRNFFHLKILLVPLVVRRHSPQLLSVVPALLAHAGDHAFWIVHWRFDLPYFDLPRHHIRGLRSRGLSGDDARPTHRIRNRERFFRHDSGCRFGTEF